MSYPYDGEWRPNGRGGFEWVLYGSGVLVAVVVIVVLAIIMNNVDMGSGSNNGNVSNDEYVSYDDGNNGGTNGAVNTSKKLTDLHIFGTHSSVTDNMSDGKVEDAYGNTYQGPYLDLYSWGNYGGEDYEVQAYTEFVAGGNYSHLSGKFFARADQEDNYTIEFLIFADDKLIYSSGEIDRKAKPIDFTVDISGCEIIRVQSRSTYVSDFSAAPSIVLVDAVVHN